MNAGTTSASITDGNILNTNAAGTVIVTATIANGAAVDTPYKQNFSIIVNEIGSGFVAVSDITGVATDTVVGIPLTLSGTVEPANASDQVITWTVSSVGAQELP